MKCDKEHALARCPEFKSLPIDQKMEFVFNKGLCLSCLVRGHRLRDCTSALVCGQNGCQRRHNRLLHGEADIRPQTLPPAADTRLATAQESPAAGGGSRRE